MAQLPYGLRALLAPRYDVSSFLLPGPESVALPAILAASSRAPTTVVARPTTYGRTFTPIKPLTNAEITALQERAVNMYTGSTRPAAATLTESGLGLQVPMFGGDGGGDGVGNSSTGGPGPSASDVGNAIAQGIAAANSTGVLGAIADPMGALTAYAVHAALSPTLSAPEDAAPISSVSETSPGVGSDGASSAGMGGASVGSAGSTAATADSPDGPDGSNASAPGGGGGGGGDSGVGMGSDSSGEGVFKAGGYVNYAGGGMVNPAQQASGLAALGRGKDSMLVHMTPSEVQGLQAMAQQQGESLTINPYTGLPEAGKLEDRLRKAAPFLAFIPGIGTAAAALGAQVGLGALASQSIAAGLIGGFAAPGKGFNFSKGLQTGLLAYGLGSAYNSMNPNAPIGGPTAPTNTMTGGPTTVSTTPSVSPGAGGVSAGQVDAFSYGDPAYYSPQTNAELLAPPPATVATATTAATDTATKVDPSKTKFEQFTGVSPTTALIGGNLAYGAYQADKEMDMYKEQAAVLRAEEERKRALARQAFENSLGRVAQPTTAAKGGLIALARGGMPTFEYGGTTAQTGEPRMVKGAGDGMSDNVPASIEGVQEARLANDEFVIPADVVADIGNGSSSAGAKKLYAMMDRIRTARHGTTDQPPAIKAEKYMPA